ncbi:class C sortase [Corynebacterium sp.]|uniref:class C sortase n=1 Tax=Corynebacterium sp. TaxID=1720 RepID=UPI0026DD8D95|nr:class C sortase [Corynebacterium sp.]MDO5032436.1 class C sortase [Corynebacterium sp.]
MKLVLASRPGKRPPQRNKAGRPARILLPALLVIIGMLVMAYPIVATAWNNHNTTKAAQEYAKLDAAAPQEAKQTQWDAAHNYNSTRTTGPILDPWLNQIDESNADYAEYLTQLSATKAMARIVIPSITVDLPLYHGTEEKTLQEGLGHLYGSDLPVGGPGTHAVITGHTGLTNVTMFDNLAKLTEGDVFYVQVSGHRMKYVVDKRSVVLPTQTEGLRPEEGKDYITLITCTPYGINSHRLLVRGHQVPLDAAEATLLDSTHGSGWQWWMYALLTAVMLAGISLAWWLWHTARRARKPQHTEEEPIKHNARPGEGNYDTHR